MTAQHTKLRIVGGDDFWSASRKGRGTTGYQFIKDEFGTVLAITVGHDPDPFNGRPSLDHSRRLVAAWNACEGITTERLEDLGRPLLHLVGCDERAAKMVTERNELLAELSECRDLLLCVETCSRNNFENLAAERVQAINAAIQKATHKEQA